MMIEDWGLIEYGAALKRQTQAVEAVIADENHPGFLIFCSHPAVVTMGRQTQAEDVFAWDGPLIEVSRGGRATYHGPSQLVVYPILNLKKIRHGRKPQEIRGYIRALEQAVIYTLAEFQINAIGKTQSNITSDLQDTGVWVLQQKVASIGIAVRQWVSFHGAAINVDHDPKAFEGLKPCGYQSSVMTNLEVITKNKISRQHFQEILTKYCLEFL